jgi:hypothetical protein
MKRDAILFILTWVVILSVQAMAQQQAEGAAPLAPVSAFLPPLGQTVHYRFSDTIVTPKESRSEAGTLTLTAVGGNEIKATLAIGEKAPRSFAFQVDPTGALQPAAELDPPSDKPHRSGKSEPSAREQAFLLRLSLAARIGAHPGEEMSMPVLLNVPWASGPVNPILYVKPTTPDAFVGEATDTTTTNPPQQGRAHIFRRIAISGRSRSHRRTDRRHDRQSGSTHRDGRLDLDCHPWAFRGASTYRCELAHYRAAWRWPPTKALGQPGIQRTCAETCARV